MLGATWSPCQPMRRLCLGPQAPSGLSHGEKAEQKSHPLAAKGHAQLPGAPAEGLSAQGSGAGPSHPRCARLRWPGPPSAMWPVAGVWPLPCPARSRQPVLLGAAGSAWGRVRLRRVARHGAATRRP